MPFKAFLGASVTTKDDKFSEIYQEELEAILKKFGLPHLKPLYKGAHLVKQADEKSAQILQNCLVGKAQRGSVNS